MKRYAVYNPVAGNGKGEEEAKKLTALLGGDLEFCDVRAIVDYEEFFAKVKDEDEVIICGGDGTLNQFVNAVKDIQTGCKLSYYACGSGNDFLRDVGDDGMPVDLRPYMEKMPTVTVKGKDYAFVNGVGYGVDGYCCEVGDKLREKNAEKPVSYTAIAIKGLLFHYKPTDATVIVDGKEYFFKKVWIAPTMNGRYYGGGMMPAPAQRREDSKLSVMIFHGSSKLKTLMIFPSIFKGEHVKKEKHVTVLSGNEITVKFTAPRPLQIDGETVLDVTEYTAKK